MILRMNNKVLKPSILDVIIKTLFKDGVIAYPTDTVFGIGCLISHKKAVDRIKAIKSSDTNKPMSILCADLTMLSDYINNLSSNNKDLLKNMLPGPYTVVMPCSYKVPSYLQKNNMVGIRIPDNAFCQAITKLAGEPIVTTSCNISGEEPLCNIDEVCIKLGHLLDLIVDCGLVGGMASTVIQLSDNNNPIVLRYGAGQWPI